MPQARDELKKASILPPEGGANARREVHASARGAEEPYLSRWEPVRDESIASHPGEATGREIAAVAARRVSRGSFTSIV
jgi:hypothetical protein